ncbi:bacillithiol transferase BstA [soil metagenome]
MDNSEIFNLKYPIGRFKRENHVLSKEERQALIKIISDFPAQLNSQVAELTDERLNTPYRPEGWTVKQLVHHLADSHMNSFMRFKLAVTEDDPIIKPYQEKLWAETADVTEVPVQISLMLLEALHLRWVFLLNSLDSDGFNRTFRHPEPGPMTIAQALSLYAWHCKHHLAHITRLAERNNW